MIVPYWLVSAGVVAICLLGLFSVVLLARAGARKARPPETAQTRESDPARAYEELKKKASFFEALLYSSEDGIVAIDNEGKNVFENQRDNELWGFPPDIVERDDREEKHRFVMGLVKDPDQVAESRRAVLENPDLCIRAESELKDGRTFDVYSSPVVGTDGTHLGRIYKFHDITDRKKGVDALRKSEMTLRSILSASPIGLALLGPNGKPEWANEGMTAIAGYSSGETRNISEMALYETEDEYLRVKEVVYRAARRGEVGATHTKWVSKDGRVLNVLLSAVALDPKDPLTRLVVTARDVTIYKRAEAELRTSEERYRVLFEDSPVGLVELDASIARSEILTLEASGVGDLRAYFDDHPGKLREITSLVKILHANKAAFDLHEVPQGRDRDKGLIQLAKLMRDSLIKARVKGMVDLGGEPETEVVTTTAGGRKMYLFSKWIVVPGFEYSHGRIIVSFIDITSQKETEAALRGAQVRLSDAGELAQLAFWELDDAGNFVFNDAFYKLLATTAEREGGYVMSPEDYFARFVHPDDLPRVTRGVEENWTNRPEVAQFEHRIVRRDGEVRHIVNRTRIVWTDSGQIAAMYGTNQDITDRRTSEETLGKTLATIGSKKDNPDKA